MTTEKDWTENFVYLVAKVFAGKDWHSLSEDEQTIVEILVNVGFLEPSKNGFVGKVIE